MNEHPGNIPKWFINVVIVCGLICAVVVFVSAVLAGVAVPDAITATGLVAAAAVGLLAVAWLQRIIIWLYYVVFWQFMAFWMVMFTIVLVSFAPNLWSRAPVRSFDVRTLSAAGIVAMIVGVIWLLSNRGKLGRHPLWDEPEDEPAPPSNMRPRPRRPAPAGPPDPQRINKEIAARKQRLNP